jgi:hypothetical protein
MGRIDGRARRSSHLPAPAGFSIGWSCFLACLLGIAWPRWAQAAGALESVAQGATQALGSWLGSAPASTVVVAAPLASDGASPRGDELALRVAALVAGRIGSGARAHPQTAQLGTALAVAGRARALVYVQTALAKGDLRTTIDVYPSVANAWDRIRNPLAAPSSHAFASAKIDAEVRSFLAPLLLEQATVDRARHDEGDVLAAACGDVDGDGGNELLLVSRARVALGRIRAGRFVPERVASWAALAPRLPVPMREPMASAVLSGGAIDVGSTDCGGVRTSQDLTNGSPLLGLPAWGGEGIVCLRPEPSAGAFDGAPVDCAMSREPRPKMAVPAPRFDAFGAASLADARGDTRTVVAVREPSGRVRIKVGDAVGVAEGTFGAQLAVGDLDQDGAPEIATSADVPAPQGQAGHVDDSIDITTWTRDASEPRGRLHIPAPAGVRAFAMCPPEDHGEPALIAVVGNEVWVVRAAVAPPPPAEKSRP